MKISWKKYKLNLRVPFVLSYGSFDFREAFIITLKEEDHIGYGEATAISYYHWSHDKIELQLDQIVTWIEEGMSIHDILNCNLLPPVKSAVECAYFDLCARKSNQKLWDYLNLPQIPRSARSSITISGIHEDDLIRQIENYNWPSYKIKMGSEADETKLDVIEKYPGKKFRIDANSGWELNWVKGNIDRLNMPQIEMIEQPFSVLHPQLNNEIRDLLRAPIFADESCQVFADIQSCLPYFDGINVKLMKCGGWTNIIEMVKEAKRNGKLVMLGCMTESSIGISHAAMLLGAVDLADVDGAVLIENDPAQGVVVTKDEIIFSGRNGSGAKLNENLQNSKSLNKME